MSAHDPALGGRRLPKSTRARCEKRRSALVVAAMFFVVIATWLGTRSRRLRRKSMRWFAALYIFIFAAMAAIFRFVAVPAALLLRAALSRQREELADASAVQYTRDPSGLRTALEKIAAADNMPRLSLLARALCIQEPDGPPSRPGIVERWMQQHPPTALGRWVHTHPPIEERIAWLRSLEGALGAADAGGFAHR
jgi:Zn-dependent protease with chaperone function